MNTKKKPKAKVKKPPLSKPQRFLKDCKGHWVRVGQLDTSVPRAGIVCNLTKMNGVKLLFLDRNEPEILYMPMRDITGVGPAFEWDTVDLFGKKALCGDPDCYGNCNHPTCYGVLKKSDFKDYKLQ